MPKLGRDAMIDPADLLAPVPGDAPQGIDLRNPGSHPLRSDLRTAWSNVRQRQQRGEAETRGDWAEVERQAAVLLRDYSKDLEVAVWLAEALVQTDGFAGLAAGGQVLNGLVAGFWDTLYPIPDPDEPDMTAEEARLEPLSYLADEKLGRLLPAVRALDLFTLDDGTAFPLAACRESMAWTALPPQERQQRLGKLQPVERAAKEKTPGGRLWDAVQQMVRAGQPEVMAGRRRDLRAAIAAWRALGAALEERVGEGRFASRPLIALLEEMVPIVTDLAPPEAAPPAPPAAEAPPAAADAAAPAAPVTAPVAAAPRRLETREDALRQLEEVTGFFRRTEPHSPLAYTLEEAMRRARLTWPEWLAEMVPDRQQRDGILLRLGLRPDGG
jgi:type VI secretion system protein ImpA